MTLPMLFFCPAWLSLMTSCTSLRPRSPSSRGNSVSAGHPEPLLLRDGRLVKSLHVDPVPPLGLGHAADPDGRAAAVTVGSEQLEPGDRVLF